MIRSDFITREIEIFIKSLANILLKKEQDQLDEARHEVNSTSLNLVGLDIPMLLTLPGETILHLMNVTGSFNHMKCYMLAELLMQEAEIRDLQGNEDSMGLYERALILFNQLKPDELDLLIEGDPDAKIKDAISTIELNLNKNKNK
ncbi:MAG TPA: hypothetical protein VK004_06805 [Ignavibacteria bacterium]|nr:hypothetical protein [Ignavibacteria bacterium]